MFKIILARIHTLIGALEDTLAAVVFAADIFSYTQGNDVTVVFHIAFYSFVKIVFQFISVLVIFTLEYGDEFVASEPVYGDDFIQMLLYYSIIFNKSQ